MSDFGDDDPYTVDRGYKTDSYIMAVSGAYVEPVEPSYSREKVQPVSTGKELLIQETPRDYGALSPDEVEYYRKDSFWKTCRWSCIVCCLLLLIFLILLTVYILLISPRCIEHDHDWWEKSVVYEIWTPSFKDSDASGKGDFMGIVEKMTQIRRLGITALYIKPFLSHTDKNGAAVDDLDDVAHELGNLKEATQMIEQAHSYGFKVIIDFPVAATSLKHPWFLKSSQASALENREYSDYYFWKKNYESTEFIAKYGNNGDVYYHIENRPELAVLNYKEPNVSSHIQKSIFEWIQRGVDGFHLKYVDYLARTTDGKYPNWNGIVKAITDLKKTIKTKLQEREDLKDKKIFFFASMENIGEMEKVRLGQKAGLDGVLNTELLKIAVGNRICEKTPDSISDCSNEVIGDILQFYQTSEEIWPLWQFGDSDTERLASRTRSRLQAELLQMVQLLLPGTPIVYYGDLLGAKEVKSMDDPQRSAMAWDDSSTAGFSDASVFQWTARLPSEWKHVNFEKEIDNPKSRIRVLKRLIQLKNIHDILFDGQTYLSKPVQNSFSLCRFWKSENDTNKEVFVLSVNFGSRPVNISIHDIPPFVYAVKHMNLQAQNDPYLEARVLAVSSAVHPENWYPQQKFNLALGQYELGVDQGILYRFFVT